MEMRDRLAKKKNTNAEELDKNLVSKKDLCAIKKRWFQIFKTDKKTLRNQLKNSTISTSLLDNFINIPSESNSGVFN